MFFPEQMIDGRYRAKTLLGRGGMGEVWVANDVQLNRNVVVKVVMPQLARTRPEYTPIFVDEARIGASLVGHPNVVTVFDVINKVGDDHLLAIVMEYVEGISCSEWVGSISKNIEQKTRYFLNLMIADDVCKALSYAHRNSILHRDVKPLNVFISKYGIAKIGDFGIARYSDAVTREHTVWGFRSPAYAAPEQWNDKRPNFHTDIYQLGCSLYHIFTGRLPFERENVAALIQAHLNDSPVSPQTYEPVISESLSKVILGCLAKSPEDRPEIWEIADAISKDVQQKYELRISFDKADADLIDSIAGITDFNSESMRQSGSFSWDYVDYNEALSEAFELIMLRKVEVVLNIVNSP